MTDFAKINRNSLVVRHNSLVESRYSMTLVERRFILWIISQIKRDDEVLKVYRVSIKDWTEFCGIKERGDIYNEAIKMVTSLAKRTTEILDKKNQRFSVFPWFGRLSYEYGEGYIEACLNTQIEDKFLQLGREHTSIKLEYSLLLNSSYAMHIYDLLKQYQRIGTRVITIDDLRKTLQLGEKHKRYQELRRNLIEISQREINNKTDISFDWQPIKTGRKVTAIKFIIRKNTPAVTMDSREYQDPKAARLLNRLYKRHGVAEQTARSLIDEFDCERIDWHIKEYENQLKAGKTLKAGWLIEAIRADHRPQQSIFAEQEAAKQEVRAQAYRDQQDATVELEKLEDLRVTIQNSFSIAAHKIALEVVESAGAKQANEYYNTFLKGLQDSDSFTVGDFEKKGWKSLLNRQAVIAFFTDIFADLFPPLSDFTTPHGFRDMEALRAKISKLEAVKNK